MFVYTVDPRDGSNGNACDTCCCEQASGRPGEINQWVINYFPWAGHVANRGLVQSTKFVVEKVECNTEQEITNQHYGFGTNTGIPVVESVSANEGPAAHAPFTYSVDPLSEDLLGDVQMNNDGSFVYTPPSAFIGYDYFWYIMEDSQGNSIHRQVAIHVARNGAAPSVVVPSPPQVNVDRSKVGYIIPHHQIRFPVEISREARQGEVYRLTVQQEARDCDCNVYRHISCYDIVIGKCR